MSSTELDQLIRQLRHKDPQESQKAIEIMRRRGWLGDGSLAGINLWGAKLAGRDLSEINLLGANLVSADLSNTNLFRATLTKVRLVGCDLRGADLTDAICMGTNLESATMNETTRLPDGEFWSEDVDLSQFSGTRV